MKISKAINPEPLRASGYDPLGDQLDRITKCLDHLAKNGVDIGEFGLAQVAHSEQIKQRFPKETALSIIVEPSDGT